MDGDQQAAEPSEPDSQSPGEGNRKDQQEERSPTRWAVELIGVVVVAILVAVLLRTFVVATYSIPSGSMEPTLKIGDRIVVDKLAYHLHGIGRGDIVVFTTPPTENCAGPPVSDLVKRVIGLPGEIISLRDGRVYVNGRLYLEPFLPPAIRNDTYPGPSNGAYSLHQPYRVPPGDVFMMGDNRPFSCDSRFWGPIKESTIVGKVDMRIWPLTRIGFF